MIPVLSWGQCVSQCEPTSFVRTTALLSTFLPLAFKHKVVWGYRKAVDQPQVLQFRLTERGLIRFTNVQKTRLIICSLKFTLIKSNMYEVTSLAILLLNWMASSHAHGTWAK